jgi:hypothetical protein
MMVLPTKEDTMTITATVTSDHERSWYEDLRGKPRSKRVDSGRTRHKKPGHGGRDVPTGKSVVYVNVKDEKFWENFANRTSRPHTEWRPYVEQALREHGFDFTKLTWSQKAGCGMCPCSPGFIVTDGTLGHDIWVTLTVDAPQRTDDEEAAWRLAQVAADPTIPGPFKEN